MQDTYDGELLSRFRLGGDDAAFAELVRRHGRTARNAAAAVLGASGDADDIAQVTFLTLARKAASLELQSCVSGWVYRVAVCLARNERRRKLGRAVREEEAAAIAVPEDDASMISDSAIAAMHEEMAGLPELHRNPLILHHLDGYSYEEAAAVIGCNAKTFSTRLVRAREKLKKRLIKRGITGVTMSALVAMLGQTAEAVEVSPSFVAATCAAAKGGAVSAKVAALTQNALKMLFWAKVKAVAAVCAGVAVVGAGGIGAAVGLPLIVDRGEPRVAPVEITAPAAPVTAGMVLIPGGTNAGTDLDTQKPYSLTVESFLMDRCEVTKALWDEVAAWGLDHGYVFEKQIVNGIIIDCGQGKAPDHPVHSVSWYDCVLWCNARSEKDGLEPVYYTDKACTVVWRQKHGLGPFVKTAADGYRLPTLVEWQYAARGGEPSHRFPWHEVETIDHSRANYYSFDPFPWDTSPMRGYHPTYAVEPKPYTSPVGAFAPNAYGLYDMAGNVSEWCFDDAGVGYKKYTGSSWTGLPSPVSWSEEAPSHPRAKTERGFRTVRTLRTVTDAGGRRRVTEVRGRQQ